jgi:hypothetical protein
MFMSNIFNGIFNDTQVENYAENSQRHKHAFKLNGYASKLNVYSEHIQRHKHLSLMFMSNIYSTA